jgi:hypothetical protein
MLKYDDHLPDHVMSFPRRQYKLKVVESESTPHPIYGTASILGLMLASNAAQTIYTFTHSLQYVQVLSTFGGCFHF